MQSNSLTITNANFVPSGFPLIQGNCRAQYSQTIAWNHTLGYRDSTKESFLREVVSTESLELAAGNAVNESLALTEGYVASKNNNWITNSGTINLAAYTRTTRDDGISHPETVYLYRGSYDVAPYTRPIVRQTNPIGRVDTTTGEADESGNSFTGFFSITICKILSGTVDLNYIASGMPIVSIKRANSTESFTQCLRTTIGSVDIWTPSAGYTLDDSSAYLIEVSVADAIDSSTFIFSLPPSDCVMFMHESGKGVGIGTSAIPDMTTLPAGSTGYFIINPDWVIMHGDDPINSSVAEMKKNIRQCNGALPIIMRTRIFSFKYKGKDGKPYGRIKFGPVIGRGCPKEIIGNNGKEIRMLSFLGLLCAATQEQEAVIKSLEQRLQELERKLN
jgi:hypothetical protein